MFKNKPLAALVALACAQAAVAATPNAQLDEVVVTATRVATPLAKVLSDVTVLGREEIEQSAALSLPQFLAAQAAVEIYNSGGEGKSGGIFLRGTSASHTLVLVDGVRIVSATTGATALEHIPLAAVERVEILRGPASSLYGADAIGGVVQIFTKRGEGAARLTANVGVGDKSKRVIGAGVSGKVGRTGYSLAFDHNQSKGFSATNPRNPNGTVDDRDGYDNTTYLASVQHELAEGHSVDFTSYHTESENEYDTTGSARQDFAKSRLSGQKIRLNNRLSDNWRSQLSYAHSDDRLQSFEHGTYSTPYSLFETRQDEWLWQNDLQLAAGQQATLGVSNTHQHVLSTDKFTNSRRDVNAAFASYQGEFGAHSVQGSLRHDDDSQFGGKGTGQIGYGFAPAAGWLLRAAYGTAFKAPTFNDLYYPFKDYGFGYSYVGNPQLKPELARNKEVGVQWRQGGNFARLTAFDNRVQDMITYDDSLPAATMRNVAKARITGQTLEAGISFGDLSLGGNVTSQRARDQNTGLLLKDRAKLHGAITAAWQLDRTRLSAELQASGRRPVKADNKEFLAGYGVLNLGADYQLDKSWLLSAKLSNAGDKVYETAKGYNQPRRGWFLGVRYAQ